MFTLDRFAGTTGKLTALFGLDKKGKFQGNELGKGKRENVEERERKGEEWVG